MDTSALPHDTLIAKLQAQDLSINLQKRQKKNEHLCCFTENYREIDARVGNQNGKRKQKGGKATWNP
jgi:hypothetical protein